MPREAIHSPTPHREGDPLAVHLEVGWQRDCDVQVGISADNDHHLVDVIYGGPQGETAVGDLFKQRVEQEQRHALAEALGDVDDQVLGRWILDSVTGSTPYGGSIWWHPGRLQINALIRLLRKARDAAFGRDE